MAVDYDCVIIGGTADASTLATAAAQRGARVVLVVPERQPLPRITNQELQALYQLGRQQLVRPPGCQALPPAVDWPQAAHWAEQMAQTQDLPFSAAALAQQGVDWIAGTGQFVGGKWLGLQVADRYLTARAYILAVGRHSLLPPVPGLAEIQPWRLEHWWQRSHLPTRLLVLGNDPSAIEMAQHCNRLGSQVTLVSDQTQLLPYADPDIGALLQQQLTAEGIVLHLGQPVTQARAESNGKHLLVGQDWLHGDDVLVTTTAPDLGGWNLEALGVQWYPNLVVGETLQTGHQRIFACGTALGWGHTAAIAATEIDTVLHNALFLPRRTVPHHVLPHTYQTFPPLGQVGLTEPRARQRYDKNTLVVLQLPLAGLPSAQAPGQTPGLAKLILHRNGQILGGHFLTVHGHALSAACATVMAQGLSLSDLPPVPPDHPLAALTLAAQHWQQQRWQPGRWRRDWAENWFNWRRNQVN
jgi:pyruvate/2-oxoglutarate dehydrogenase complex dihydrolipoamide dehydrogenase (E3) component